MAPELVLWVQTIEAVEGRAIVDGDVWCGPIEPGTRLTGVSYWDHQDRVELVVEELAARFGAQETGRTLRVTVTITGDGVDRVRPGCILTGSLTGSSS